MASDALVNSACYMHEGIGWDYEFRPGATASFGYGDTVLYNYTDNCNQTWHGPSLVPSVVPSNMSNTFEPVYYGSYETWDNLLGCPLNGAWQITIFDYITIDNGYLFNWGIDFADTLQNQMTEYVVGVDSAMFRGPGIQQLTPFSAQISNLNVGCFAYEVNVYDEFGCDFFATFATICVLSIDEQDNLNALSFYPNPAVNYINCKILNPAWENSTLEIYTINGKLLEKRLLSELDTKLNLSQLSNDTYLIKVTNPQNKTKTVKIIKSK